MVHYKNTAFTDKDQNVCALIIKSATYLWEIVNMLFVERRVIVKSSLGSAVDILKNMQNIKNYKIDWVTSIPQFSK